MAPVKPVIIKTLLRCTHCGKVETFNAVAVLVFDDSGRLYIRGPKGLTLEQWDKLAEQLPSLIRHAETHAETKEEI